MNRRCLINCHPPRSQALKCTMGIVPVQLTWGLCTSRRLLALPENLCRGVAPSTPPCSGYRVTEASVADTLLGVGDPMKNRADFRCAPLSCQQSGGKAGLGPARRECSDLQVRATCPGARRSGLGTALVWELLGAKIPCRPLQGLQKIPWGGGGGAALSVEGAVCLRFGAQMIGLLENLKE